MESKMKESTKGMLLSGLVYPGLGQLIIGQVFSGVLFVLLTTAGFCVFLYRIIQRLAGAIDQILPLLVNNELDFNTLKELLDQKSSGGWEAETISITGIAVCWLAAILHAYFAGKKVDSQFRSNQ